MQQIPPNYYQNAVQLPIVQQIPQQAQYQVHQQIPQQVQKPQELVVYLTEKPSIWSSGICDCCMNPEICIQGCLCPCVLFGKNMENGLGEKCATNCLCYLFCCGPAQHSGQRRRLRVKYNLPQDPCNDCCLVWCCPTCALCQEANEIKSKTQGRPSAQFMV